MDKEIWNVGASYGFGDFTLSAEYMRGDKEYSNAGKDGWWADLAWKGAEADQPGSYGIQQVTMTRVRALTLCRLPMLNIC